MRVGRLRQREGLVDVDDHLAARDHLEQLGRHRFGFLLIGHVVEQGRARDVQRTALGQFARREGFHGAGRIAEADHQAAPLQAVERRSKRVLAHRVVDHRHAGPARDLFHTRHDVLVVVVDDVRGAMRQRQFTLLLRADGADQLHTKGARPLAGDQAHAPGCGVEQDRLAGLQRVGRAKQVLHRQALQHHGGCRLERDRIRELDDDRGRHHAQVGVGAVGPAGVRDAVARLHVGHALAHRLDHARAFLAQAAGQRLRIQAGAKVHVDEVQADRVLAQQDLARPGRAHVDIDIFHHLGAAIGGDADCFGVHAVLLCVRQEYRIRACRRRKHRRARLLFPCRFAPPACGPLDLFARGRYARMSATLAYRLRNSRHGWTQQMGQYQAQKGRN